MGTRSIITFVEENTVLLSIYRQFDGYLEGRGKQLAEFMANINLVNGYGVSDKGVTHANGMGCLAAQWLMHEKADFFQDTHDFSGGSVSEHEWTPEAALGNVYIQQAQEWPDPKDVFIEYFYRVEVEQVETEEGTMPRSNIILSVCDRNNPGNFEFRGSPEDMLKFIEHYMDEDTGDVNENNPYVYKNESEVGSETVEATVEELFS